MRKIQESTAGAFALCRHAWALTGRAAGAAPGAGARVGRSIPTSASARCTACPAASSPGCRWRRRAALRRPCFGCCSLRCTRRSCVHTEGKAG
eukprot:467386-Prymnesium_polylepis.2